MAACIKPFRGSLSAFFGKRDFGIIEGGRQYDFIFNRSGITYFGNIYYIVVCNCQFRALAMTTAKTFIAAFCAGCVVLGAISILVPKGNLSKAVKYAISLAFLCTVLSVAITLGSFDLPSIKADSKTFTDERHSAATAKVVFAEALSGANINFWKIKVFTDKSDSGGISITKVWVYTAAPIEKVNAVIGSKDYEVVVVNE